MNSNSGKTKTHQIEPNDQRTKLDGSVQNGDHGGLNYLVEKQKCPRCKHLGTIKILLFRKIPENGLV